MKVTMTVCTLLLVASIALVGCGGGASETKPIADVAAEAQSMDAKQLEGMVAKYQKAIESKEADLMKIKDKLKDIPVKDLLGDEAKAIKGDISEVTSSMKALSERLSVYAKELKNQA